MKVNICKGLAMIKETCNFALISYFHWTHYRNGLGTRNLYNIYFFYLGFYPLVFVIQLSVGTASFFSVMYLVTAARMFDTAIYR